MYVACSSSRTINSLAIKRDTIGLQVIMSNVACYGDSWKRVNSLVLFNDCVIILHDKGANINWQLIQHNRLSTSFNHTEGPSTKMDFYSLV